MATPIPVTINRTKTGDEGTFGKLVLPSGWSCATGELPWRDNAHNISCIPAGCYRGVLVDSSKSPTPLIQLQDVPGRDHILIHKGNWCGDVAKGYKSDVEGCILLGIFEGVLANQRAVVASYTAVTKFYEYIGDREIMLNITEDFA